jgi:hypothetical protein
MSEYICPGPQHPVVLAMTLFDAAAGFETVCRAGWKRYPGMERRHGCAAWLFIIIDGMTAFETHVMFDIAYQLTSRNFGFQCNSPVPSAPCKLVIM